jgi:hypothetical protein
VEKESGTEELVSTARQGKGIDLPPSISMPLLGAGRVGAGTNEVSTSRHLESSTTTTTAPYSARDLVTTPIGRLIEGQQGV